MIALGQKVVALYENIRVLKGGHIAKHQYALLIDNKIAFRRYSTFAARGICWRRWRSAPEMTADSLSHLQDFERIA